MTVEPGWVAPGIDTTKANAALVHDYWLGGNHNFQADRDLAWRRPSRPSTTAASPLS